MRIIFMGTPESAVPSLRRLLDDGHEIVAVWTQPDRPVGRHQTVHASPVKEFALANDLPIYQPAKIKNDEAKKLFASHNADAAIVVAYGKILPAEFLNATRQRCINLHFSLLPKYRGAAPVNWAIVNGEQESGVTTMKIVAELDAGPILLQESTRIRPDETAAQLMSRLADMGAELLSETLRTLKDIEPKPQLNEEATFAPMLKRADGQIDWSMDAFAIERRVRGFQPWPNAWTTFRSHRLIIWEASPGNTRDSSTKAGEIVRSDGDDLLISSGDSTVLHLSEVQVEGSRRMSARDFINGMRPKAGDALGKLTNK